MQAVLTRRQVPPSLRVLACGAVAALGPDSGEAGALTDGRQTSADMRRNVKDCADVQVQVCSLQSADEGTEWYASGCTGNV